MTTDDEMMRSQVELMKAQQKAYLENKEFFDRRWAKAIPPREALERFRAWCETC